MELAPKNNLTNYGHCIIFRGFFGLKTDVEYARKK